MIRIIAFLGGLGFITALVLAFFTPRDEVKPSAASIFHKEHKEISFSSDGPLGKFDRGQLQRGFQVYKEVCSACHSIRHVAFGDMIDLGYTPAEVKKIASDWPVKTPSINPDTGEMMGRPSLPSDKFPLAFANDTAALLANNNVLPPDLSLITKAREGGAPYVYSILTGYTDPPAELAKRFPKSMPKAPLSYNPYFPTLNIAMAQQLRSEGQVTYADGTKSTVDQMAKDVSAFLIWTAEPKLEARHRAGVATLIFLLIFAGLCFLSYRNIWSNKEH
jgi:ubiquinol-cytochrome c reductase cytochrome c1 subunit